MTTFAERGEAVSRAVMTDPTSGRAAMGCPPETPWKDEDTLVPVSEVVWLAKNTFLVTVPSYRRKVSCELTAVDVPRLSDDTFLALMGAIVQHMNQAVRCFLRQDLYSTFPLEGYGDIIFSFQRECDCVGRSRTEAVPLQWVSLQETLLLAGMGCVIRPSPIRARELFAAESAGGGAKTARFHLSADVCLEPHPWLARLRRKETVAGDFASASSCSDFCRCSGAYGHYKSASCVVQDVIRGDVYAVRWLEVESSLPLPPLIILDGTTCLGPGTAAGFGALRWAQQHLIGRHLELDVHSVNPCDKDVANNTQLSIYEELAHARVTVRLATNTELAGLPSDLVCKADGFVDVGEVLVRLGLAYVRRPADAGVPRPTNFVALCTAVADLTVADEKALMARDNSSLGGALDSCLKALSRRWELPLSWTDVLLSFNGEVWRSRFVAQHMLRQQAPPGKALRMADQRPLVYPREAPPCQPSGLIAACWHRYVWCGSISVDPSRVPRTVRHRALRTLMSMESIADLRCCQLRGYVSGVSVARAGKGDASAGAGDPTTTDSSALLQLEIMLVNPSRQWYGYSKLAGIASSALQSIRFTPEPDAETVYQGSVLLSVVVGDSDSGHTASATGTSVRVSCQMYSLSEFMRLKAKLLSGRFSSVFTEVEGPRYDVTLSVPASTSSESAVYVYVVDVEAVLRSSDGAADNAGSGGANVPDAEGSSFDATTVSTTRSMAVYYLSPKLANHAEPAAVNAMRAANSPSSKAQPPQLSLPVPTDLLADAVEEVEKELRQQDDDAAAAADNDKVTKQGEALPADVGRDSTQFQCPVFFYFHLANCPAPDALRSVLKYLYTDVECMPVGLAEVNGVRGFLGDVLFKRQDDVNQRARFVSCLGLLASGETNDNPTTAIRHDAGEAKSPVESTALRDAMQDFHQRVRAQLVAAERNARTVLVTTVAKEHQLLLCQMAGSLASLRVPNEIAVSECTEVAVADGDEDHEAVKTPGPTVPRGPGPFTDSPLRLRAGAAPLWRDADAALSFPHLSAAALPTSAPLFLFSVFPRQLFPSNVNKLRKIAQDMEENHGENHVDWAFMRLSFPSLPCILREDLERLPRSLRNTERAFCESLMRGEVGGSADPPTGGRSTTPSPDTRKPRSPSTTADQDSPADSQRPLFAAEKPLAALLSLLFLLRDGSRAGREQPEEVAAKDFNDHHQTVYRLLKERCEPLLSTLHARTQTCDVVLYRVPVAPSATPTGGGTEADEMLFIGSRDTFVTDAFGPTTEGQPLPALSPTLVGTWLNRRTVAAVGFETFTESVGETADVADRDINAAARPSRRDLHRSLVDRGFGPEAMDRSLPVLYHPLPWLAVLGDPLVQRRELTAEALVARRGATDTGCTQTPSTDECLGTCAPPEDTTTKLIGLRYIPLFFSRAERPYHLSSYGRLSKKDVETLRLAMEEHGDSLQCYLSLLLRPPPPRRPAARGPGCDNTRAANTEERPSAFADGLLTVLGTPLDPLYVHYRSRRDLRFTLGSVYPSVSAIQACVTVGSDRSAELAELAMLEQLSLAVRKIMTMIVSKLCEDAKRRGNADSSNPTRILLRCSARCIDNAKWGTNYMAVRVYPVEMDDERMEPVDGDTTCPAAPGSKTRNPHQPFDLLGVTLGMLPRHELRLHYDPLADSFDFTWNKEFEDADP